MRGISGLCAVLLASVCAVPAAVQAQTPPAAAQPAPSAADLKLRALYDGYSAWDAKEGGYFEDARGENKPTDYLPHVDEASQFRRAQHLKDLLDQVNAISAAQLSPDERVNAAVFRTVLEGGLSDAHFRLWEMPFNSDSSFWTYLNERDPLQDAAEYRRYISRMRDIPRFFDEQIANMRGGLKRGFTVPRSTLTGRDQSIATFITPDVRQSPFYQAFEKMPAAMPQAEQEALRTDAEAVIAQSVLPAYRKLLDFFRSEYLPGARSSVSAHDLPDGDAFYRAQIKQFTTLDMGPEEIHQLGLKEVARIDAEMQQTMRDSGFKGMFPEFLTFLKTDPQFYARTPDELLGVSSYVAKRVDGKLADTFGLLPRRRFTIIPVPDALAPFYTAGRGGLESCMMNTYNLPTRPLYNIPVLTLHECEPGHAFQAAVALEQKALPTFRRNLYV